MDEMLPVMLPIEDSAAVYSIVYPGEQPAIGPEGSSFFDLLVEQFSQAINTSDQASFQNLLSLELPVLTVDQEQVGEEFFSEEMFAELAESVFPFQLLQTGEEAPLLEAVDIQVPFDQMPEEVLMLLEQERSNFVGNGLDLVETVGEQILAENVTTEVSMPEDIQRVLNEITMQQQVPIEESLEPTVNLPASSEDTTAELGNFVHEYGSQPEAETEQAILNATPPDFKGEEVVVDKSQHNMNQPTVFDSLAKDQATFVSDETLEGDTKSSDLDFLQFLNANSKGSTEQVQSAAVDEHFVAPQTFNELTAEMNETIESTLSFGQNSQEFTDTPKQTLSDDFSNELNNEEFVPLEQNDIEKTTESSFESRVKQAEEAQLITKQIIKSAQLRQGVTKTEFTLSLEPDYLGALKINIALEGDTVFARFAADTAHTRDVLSENLTTLKQSLENAGIKFDEIEVTFENNQSGFELSQQDMASDSKQASTQRETANPFAIPDYDFNNEDLVGTQTSLPSMNNGLYHVNYLA